jgi:hypothetical protein
MLCIAYQLTFIFLSFIAYSLMVCRSKTPYKGINYLPDNEHHAREQLEVVHNDAYILRTFERSSIVLLILILLLLLRLNTILFGSKLMIFYSSISC